MHPSNDQVSKTVDKLYVGGLTSQVQASINQKLSNSIAAARYEWDLRTTSTSIQEDLVDRSSVNTPDFILRRYIQENLSNLLPKGIAVTDLTTSKNSPWCEDIEKNNAVIDSVSKLLAKKSYQIGAKITKAEWINYLTGESETVKKREKVFMIAFTLGMDVDATIELLMAFRQEDYSVRHPKDLICLFCQSSPEPYTWKQAEEMYVRFMQNRIPNLQGELFFETPSEGMTAVIENKLDSIFESNLPAGDAANALVDYMITNSREFVSFPSYSGNEIFHPGYSRGRMNSMLRLGQYLKKIYPYYYQKKQEKGKQKVVTPLSTRDATITKVNVDNTQDGGLNLCSLAKAMFSLSGWAGLDWSKSVHRDNTDDSPEGKFESDMRVIFDNYEQHMYSIQKLFSGGVGTDVFKRRDALLWIFFLLSGYTTSEIDGVEHSVIMQQIPPLNESDNSFDKTIKRALKKALRAQTVEDPKLKFEMLRTSFDMILFEIGYHQLYMPAVLDRLLLLSLMAENPHKLAAQIMCQMDMETFGDPSAIQLSMPLDFWERFSVLHEIKCEKLCGKPLVQKVSDDSDKDGSFVSVSDDLSVELLDSEKELLESGGFLDESAIFDLSDFDLNDPVHTYIKNISVFPLLTHGEEVALAKLIQQGDQNAKKKMIEHNLRLVVFIARKYKGMGVDLMDLIGEGALELTRAVETYDYTRGTKFSTYAMPKIRGAITSALSEQSRSVRISRNMSDRIYKITKYENAFEQHFGRKPTVEETSKELELKPKQVYDAKRAAAPAISLDSPIGEDDDEIPFGEITPDRNPRVDELAILEEQMKSIAAALHTLDEWEKVLIQIRTGMVDGNPYTIGEVASLFNVDNDIICQAEKAVLQKLRRDRAIKKIRSYYTH